MTNTNDIDDLEMDMPGTIVCFADMQHFMALEDKLKEAQQRIAELEAYIKKIEDGSNAKHWPEFGPSGG